MTSDEQRVTNKSSFLLSPTLFMVLLVLVAVGFRLYRIDQVPPGWRDDELINSLVISQHALDGDIELFYHDASGHEGLYHILNAPFLAQFGTSWAGIRLLSIIMGTMTIPLVYLLTREMGQDEFLARVAAVAMVASFWSLMYSRTGIRHIALLWLVLPSFYCFWYGFQIARQGKGGGDRAFVFAGLWLGLSFYTYFASRGVPLIFIAFAIYLLIVARPWLGRTWRGFALTMTVAIFVGLPLYQTLQNQPVEAEGRVEELAVPVVEARDGNFEPLWEHIVGTLGMFHATGDNENLYNIPDRPLFGPIPALLFWLGVVLAIYYALLPLWSREPFSNESAVSAFLLLWWGAGISPGFLSVPPASLSHTILAQPATYILLFFPLFFLERQLVVWHIPQPRRIVWGIAIVVIALTGWRDIDDYFREWPALKQTRFLYRAEIHELGDYVRTETEITDFAMSSLLFGPWDRIALNVALQGEESGIHGRLFQPQRVLFLQPSTVFTKFPHSLELIEAEKHTRVEKLPNDGHIAAIIDVSSYPLDGSPEVCFANGFCVLGTEYNEGTAAFDIIFRVDKDLTLPPMPLISNPPPPGIYAGPRLHVFAQLLTADGQFVTGDDGLWVDVTTLRVGDAFLQRHFLPIPADADCRIAFGFYDPFDGSRVLTDSGADHVLLENCAN